MPQKLHLTTFQIAPPPQPSQGLRIGVTRRPPRGVPKDCWAADEYFDIWLPALAPSAELLGQLKTYDFDNPARRKAFFDRYEKELLDRADTRQTVELVAHIAARMPVAIGCFCQDESRCHCSRLKQILLAHAPA